jgi:predicted RNA-binding Zn-ribbon protein involved in translation (DUF1610 family)
MFSVPYNYIRVGRALTFTPKNGGKYLFADLLHLSGDRMIQTTCPECESATVISGVRDAQDLTADYHCPECDSEGSIIIKQSEIRLSGAVRLSHLLGNGNSARHDFP